MNWLTSRCAPLVALTALALAGCDKGTDLNVDLPDTTAISTEYKDYSLDVATVRLAPVQTLKTEHFLVGKLTDNVAGTTEARAYFNVVDGAVTDSLPSKLTNPVLDSVVMIMGFDQVYGSATAPVKFDVYALPASLDERQTYDANSSQPLGTATVLGTNLTSRLDRTQQIVTPATTTAAAYTSTVPDQTVRLVLQRAVGTPSKPAISLPLATDLFNKLKQPNYNQTQLDAALKGLAVVPSQGFSGSIVSFGRAFDSRMTVYFHSTYPVTARPDTTLHRSYSLFFGPVYSSHTFSAVRDPRYYTQIISALPSSLAVLNNQSGSVDPSLLNGTSFVQEGTGLGTRVTFKTADIDALRSQNGLVVNRAELRVPVKPYTNALFPNPTQLYAVEVDASNTVLTRILNFTTVDRVVQADGFSQLSSGSPAIGTLTDLSTSQPYYSIPVTSYLGAYLKNQLDGNPTSLVLVPNIRASTTLSLNRAALDAANIRLRVYYSKR